MYKGPIRVTSGDICGISRNCVRDRIPVMTWVILLCKALGLGKILHDVRGLVDRFYYYLNCLVNVHNIRMKNSQIQFEKL